MIRDTLVLLSGGLVFYQGAVQLGRSSERGSVGWLLIVLGISLAAIGTWRLVADLMIAPLS